jgi:hypothetical protein
VAVPTHEVTYTSSARSGCALKASKVSVASSLVTKGEGFFIRAFLKV